MIQIPVGDIAGVREAKVFKTAVTAGRRHLVIRIPTGEVGFLVDDNSAWITSLADVTGRRLDEGHTVEVGSAESDSRGSGFIRKRGGPKWVVAVVFTSIGLVIGSAAGITAAVKAHSFSGNHYADGTVVGFDDSGKGHAPIVEFVPTDGAPTRFTGALSGPPAFDVGDRVQVRYDPDDPKNAAINRFWYMWFGPVFLGVFALPFVVCGIVFGFLAIAARKRRTAGSDVTPA